MQVIRVKREVVKPEEIQPKETQKIVSEVKERVIGERDVVYCGT